MDDKSAPINRKKANFASMQKEIDKKVAKVAKVDIDLGGGDAFYVDGSVEQVQLKGLAKNLNEMMGEYAGSEGVPMALQELWDASVKAVALLQKTLGWRGALHSSEDKEGQTQKGKNRKKG